MIVDSSVFISFYSEADVHHKEAVEIFKKIENSVQIIISDYILNEIISVLLRKFGLKNSLEVLDAILNSSSLYIRHTSEEEFYEIVEVFKNQKDNLSFIDCSILWLAIKSNLEINTFDKNLKKEILNK